jgi:hypothetical protein
MTFTYLLNEGMHKPGYLADSGAIGAVLQVALSDLFGADAIGRPIAADGKNDGATGQAGGKALAVHLDTDQPASGGVSASFCFLGVAIRHARVQKIKLAKTR